MKDDDDDDDRDLFDDEPPRQPGAFARNSDPRTSHAAAAGVNVNRLESTVVRCFESHREGLTTHEIEALSGLAFGSVTPRMVSLERKRLVIRTEQTRPPRWVRRYTDPQIVWKLAPPPKKPDNDET